MKITKVIQNTIAVLSTCVLMIVFIISGIFTYQHFNTISGILVSGLWLFLVIVSYFLIVKKRMLKNVWELLFWVHLFTFSIVLGLEVYDLKYTNRFQIHDSILHYVGWYDYIKVNPKLEYLAMIRCGQGAIIAPSIGILCLLLGVILIWFRLNGINSKIKV